MQSLLLALWATECYPSNLNFIKVLASPLLFKATLASTRKVHSVSGLVVVTFAGDVEKNHTNLYQAAKGLNRAENCDLLWSIKIQ